MTYDQALAKAFQVMFDAMDGRRIGERDLSPLTVLKIVKEYADLTMRVYNQGFAAAKTSAAEPPPSIAWNNAPTARPANQ